MTAISNLNSKLIKRIEDSGLTLSVVYPAARQVVTGVAPGAAPINPLTGSSTPTVFPAQAIPSKPAVTLKCLWYDLPSGLSLATGDEKRDHISIGVVEGATALARVLVKEAATDKAKPYGITVFSDAEEVNYQGLRFEIIQVTPMGSGRGLPVSYHCWLKGTK